MCGIGGLSSATAFGDRQAQMVERMLRSLHRRGTHAFGYQYNWNGNYEMHKEPGPYYRSSIARHLPTILKEDAPTDVGMHTRYATEGDPDQNQNNHPFDFGSFVMAHNGVIYRRDKFDNPTDIETDSFWALYWIQQEYEDLGENPDRTAEAIERGIEHVTGAYAIWLYNKDNGKTYLFRNALKPCKTGIVEGEDWVLFASDKDAIDDTLGADKKFGVDKRRIQADFDWFDEEVGGSRGLNIKNIKTLPPHTIYALNEGKVYREKIMKPKPVSPKIRMQFRQDYSHLYKNEFNSPIPGVV